MSQNGLPPPPAPPCLDKGYPSSQKGGTLIAQDVTDLSMHLKRLHDPDGYRPSKCNNCGHDVLHVHDYRERVLAAEPEAGPPVITVIRYLCPACKATWRILPAFVARHLWRSWRVVQAHALDEARPSSWPSVPERTRRRWVARLRAAAARLVQALCTSGESLLKTLAARLGPQATREQLVRQYASTTEVAPSLYLAKLAARIHGLAPGVRVM
ncbi:MAG: transposase family protein [Chloroflexi bacterium]|nr:transposase family protein [Chloroflexota bacterium]